MTEFKVGDIIKLKDNEDNKTNEYFAQYMDRTFPISKVQKAFGFTFLIIGRGWEEWEGLAYRFEKVSLVQKIDKQYEKLYT